ncbi:MAG: amidohydrolase family protein [Chloroflexota bacterium]
MIDLTHLPAVDVHCHPFLNPGTLSVERFVDAFSFSGGGVPFMVEGGLPHDQALIDEVQGVRRNALYHRYAIRQLARFFECEPNLEEVVAARNQASETYTDYTRRLYSACGLTTLVADFGYPLPAVDIAAFKAEIAAQVIPIYRIEPLIVELLAADIDWSEFKQRYDETIVDAIQHGGFYGLKSVIAYRTGLDVSPLTRTADQGMQALDAIRRGIGGNAMKKLRDHLLCRSLELCMDLDVPMQIHTGMGDYEVNLVKCRPGLLMDLLRFPIFRACRVLLVHTGYPYHAEAGYMANMLPRVYCDVSEGIPFAAHAAERIYLETLEMAPLNKVLFGTDGYTMPEINFVGTTLGKQALGRALQRLIDEDFLGEADALEAGAWILAENAQRLYGIDE